MVRITAESLLETWETTQSASAPGRALALLALGQPGEAQELAAISLGARDAQLLALREALFGEALEAVTACPSCAAAIEISCSTAELRASVAPQGQTFELVAADRCVQFRLPTTLDLLALRAAASDLEERRQLLLSRCVAAVDGAAPGALEPALLEAVEARMAELDAQADVRIACGCPECGAEVESVLDISAYLAAELEGWGRRMLLEVHTLARAYGWSERDILAMSARRRGAYLKLLSEEA